MKRFSISKKVWLTAAAVALTAGISLPGAMAYFTTYASAGGWGIRRRLKRTLVTGPRIFGLRIQAMWTATSA